MEDDTFQKGIVSRKADQLAARLSKALAPLFSRSVDERANAVFESWDQPSDVCEDRRFRFKGMFEASLRLKAATVGTDDRYEFVVYPPGTSAGHSGAEIERSVIADRLRTDLRAPASGQWLHASFNTYPGEPVFPTNPMADALIQPQNFLTDTSKDRRLQCLSSQNLTLPKPQDQEMTEFEQPMEPVCAALSEPTMPNMETQTHDPVTASAVSSATSRTFSAAETFNVNKRSLEETGVTSVMLSAPKRTKFDRPQPERERPLIECDDSTAECEDSDSDNGVTPTGKVSFKC